VIGPCAKTKVKCTIITRDGERFVGENLCGNAQSVCPRLPGEGYEKCKSICQTIGHAEEVALIKAGSKAKGARAYIEGHTWACQSCQILMFSKGIEAFTVGVPPN
jgi:deoxycytidylate deaminase